MLHFRRCCPGKQIEDRLFADGADTRPLRCIDLPPHSTDPRKRLAPAQPKDFRSLQHVFRNLIHAAHQQIRVRKPECSTLRYGRVKDSPLDGRDSARNSVEQPTTP